MKLVQVILVPVEFDVDVVEKGLCCHEVQVGWCLSDGVGGESDRHSHRGRIYRRASEDEDWSSFENDVIFVYVPEVELHKFDRQVGYEE
jgi:hypothetical protein